MIKTIYVNSALKHNIIMTCGRRVGKSPRIFTFGSRWRWVTNVTLLSLYPCKRLHRFPWNRRKAPQSRFELEANRIPFPARNRTSIIEAVASHFSNWGVPSPLILLELLQFRFDRWSCRASPLNDWGLSGLWTEILHWFQISGSSEYKLIVNRLH